MVRCWPVGTLAPALVFTPCGLTCALALDSPTVRIRQRRRRWDGRDGARRGGGQVSGRPVARGALLLPYVNGRRWGSTTIPPMPRDARASTCHCQTRGSPRSRWSACPPGALGLGNEECRQADDRLQHAFNLPAAANGARLRVAVDDVAEVFLNGHGSAGSMAGRRVSPFPAFFHTFAPVATCWPSRRTTASCPAASCCAWRSTHRRARSSRFPARTGDPTRQASGLAGGEQVRGRAGGPAYGDRGADLFERTRPLARRAR